VLECLSWYLLDVSKMTGELLVTHEYFLMALETRVIVTYVSVQMEG